jgi:hypothetical protein
VAPSQYLRRCRLNLLKCGTPLLAKAEAWCLLKNTDASLPLYFERFRLHHDGTLSNFAFKFKLRRYNTAWKRTRCRRRCGASVPPRPVTPRWELTLVQLPDQLKPLLSLNEPSVSSAGPGREPGASAYMRMRLSHGVQGETRVPPLTRGSASLSLQRIECQDIVSHNKCVTLSREVDSYGPARRPWRRCRTS